MVFTILAGCGGPAALPSGADHVERSLSGAALLRDFRLEGDHYVSSLLENPRGGTRVGFLLDVESAAAGVHLEARSVGSDGHQGEWLPAVFTWAEATMRVGRIDFEQRAYAVQLRLPRGEFDSLLALTFSLLVPGEVDQPPLVDGVAGPVALRTSTPEVRQGLVLEGVNDRASWGARATRCTALNETKTKMSVHHTAGPSTPNPDYPARLRGIQSYHMDSQGWCDVGYHYFVTADGQTWEAREAKYLGAHAYNQNTNNLGVVFVGCFQVNGCSDFTPFEPPDVMIEAGGELLGKNAAHYGITVSPSTLMGHRDNPDQQTSCPGDNLHALLDELRALAAGGGGVSSMGTVKGVVWDLSVTASASESLTLGGRLPGAAVTSNTGDTTLARDDDAYWSLDLTPGTYTLTASLDGYAATSREVQVTGGSEVWASFGLAPSSTSATLIVIVTDADTGVSIPYASVAATGVDTVQTDLAGEVRLVVAAGEIQLTVVAEGYEPFDWTETVTAGDEQRIEVGLVPLEDDGTWPGRDHLPIPDRNDDEVELVVLTSSASPGCGCALGDAESGEPTRQLATSVGLALFALCVRRRRPLRGRAPRGVSSSCV